MSSTKKTPSSADLPAKGGSSRDRGSPTSGNGSLSKDAPDLLLEIMSNRRSVRSFTEDDVTDEQLERLMEAAVAAPSAGNVQPWRFVAVRDRSVQKGLIRAALGQSFVGRAPVTLVALADLKVAERAYGARGRHLYCLQDASAAIQNLLLMAHALGLGACWVGAFDEEEASEVLGLHKHERPVAIIPVGVPSMQPAAPPRRTTEEVFEVIG